MIVWVVRLTLKDWLTWGAAFQLVLPDWFASMVQRPVESRVTEVPATVQTAGVDEPKLTARPELAVAPTVTGESARILSARAAEGDDLVGLIDGEGALHGGGGAVSAVPGLVRFDSAIADGEEADDLPATEQVAGVVEL